MSLAGLLAIVAWRPASACRCRRIRGGLQTGVEPRSIAWYALVVLERDGQVKIVFNGVRRHGRCSCRRLSMPTGGSVPKTRENGSLSHGCTMWTTAEGPPEASCPGIAVESAKDSRETGSLSPRFAQVNPFRPACVRIERTRFCLRLMALWKMPVPEQTYI